MHVNQNFLQKSAVAGTGNQFDRWRAFLSPFARFETDQSQNHTCIINILHCFCVQMSLDPHHIAAFENMRRAMKTPSRVRYTSAVSYNSVVFKRAVKSDQPDFGIKHSAAVNC